MKNRIVSTKELGILYGNKLLASDIIEPTDKRTASADVFNLKDVYMFVVKHY